MRTKTFALSFVLSLLCVAVVRSDPPTMDEAFFNLVPYLGRTANTRWVENETLAGKVLCGYQGWFTAAGDGSPRPWIHYAMQGKFEPGFSAVDMWPDMSEMDDDEKYPTPFQFADGRTATVFSSQNYKTVRRHFQWMRDHDLDGVFLQRFPTGHDGTAAQILNQVVVNVRQAANETGRCWALMYDLSGKREGEIESVVKADWKRLVDKMRLGKDVNDKSYLRHNGKPVVAVWGIGFNDNRRYTLAECLDLVKFLKDDPVYGGNCVMIGVPTYWRERTRDCLDDPLVHEIIETADIVSPWTVGRYATPEQATRYVETVAKDDMAWCRDHNVEYLPVVFPGFSWQNLMRGRGEDAKLNAIPRLGGKFLDAQYAAQVDAGATMIYQAMFDEIDEGTAIFKCATEVPVGASAFANETDLPSDFYLKLVSKWTKILRNR
ncbi:MAG: glycoside hydrolase family 71/99-like protein [Thermoguttaceae bacterium]